MTFSIADSKRPSLVDEVDNARFISKSASNKYSQSVPIQHWQLRNSIACLSTTFNSTATNLVVMQRSSVIKLQLPDMQQESILEDLNFRPASMAVGNGYGQINAGGSINNALEISRHFNEDRILVCNNDQCLKIYSLPSLSEAAIITYPTPINASAISPDGSKMVTVGDTSDIFFHGLNSPASTIPEYKLVSTLKATNDASFSISWNPSSSVFAVGSQDGFVSVFDVRKLGQKLALLKSFQNHRDRQAVRKVTFSPSGSIDLLAFSEHLNYINVVDTRNFMDHQVIRLTDEFEDRNISGLAFSADSLKLFASLEDTIYEYNINSLKRRTFGSWAYD